MRNTLLSAVIGASMAMGGTAALAAGKAAPLDDVDFSFEGLTGSFDREQLQRGLGIYTQVCAGCHGLKFVPFRALEDLGYSDAQVRVYASQYFVPDDGPDAQPGDEREALPTDHFPAVDGLGAPDLSLMAKARAGFSGPYGTGINQLVKGIGGPEYIANLLRGYVDPPECAADSAIDGWYNAYFTAGGYPEECKDENGKNTTVGSWIGMGQPLYGDDVEHADGTEATLEQSAEDVAAFLMWTAEPTLETRKVSGLSAMLFLGFLTVLLYFTNKKLWSGVKNRKEA